jgi:hypothetical protein
MLRVPAARPAALRCLRLAVPRLRSRASCPAVRPLPPPDLAGSAGLGLFFAGCPFRPWSWRRRGFPGSWGTPVWTCPALRPRRDRWARPFSARPVLPSVVTTPSAPAMSKFLRGSMTRPIHWLSTLRGRDRSRTTQDSLPAAGLLCRVGLATHWVPVQGLASHVAPPCPGFAWRTVPKVSGKGFISS